VSVIKTPFANRIRRLWPRDRPQGDGADNELMVWLVIPAVAYLRAFCLTRHNLALEIAALRQQLTVFKRKQPRPQLRKSDRLFWILLRRLWSSWSDALILVKPETVISWHRAGFQLFWRWRSRPDRPGRPRISAEIRQLIRRMKADNPTWGAPRIHGELIQLGLAISEPTISRYLHQLKRPYDADKAKRWLTFLNNHREVLAAFDFFTVPTLTFRVLYCFFVIEHGRRKILHFHATAHPTSEWIVQQLREAFPLPCPYRYVIFDHDAKFSPDVRDFLTTSGIKPIRTSIRSPWQNGIAERWVGSCRRDLLDHVIPLNEEHLRRLGREYLAYYHEDRTHNALRKTTPANRPIEPRPSRTSEVLISPRIGGLHHRYTWSPAA
jgi:putative transposase